MKKIVSILTVAVLLVACMSVSVFAANAPVVTAEEVNVEMGKTVEVKVSISEATFASYGLKLTYDTDALTLVEIKQGERSQGMFSAKAESGKVGLVNTADTTGAGVLFTAVFEAKAPGKHEVKVEVDSFAKADTSILEVEVDNGFVNVECAHNWEVTNRPAKEEDGCWLEYKCSICGETKRVDKEAHTWELVELTEEGERQKCSFCGVERIYNPESGDMIGVVIALLAVSGLGITVLRKREN